MSKKFAAALVVISGLVANSATINAEESHAHDQTLKLSPEVLNLLRAEMREIAGGMQGIVVSLASADWHSIHETGAKIRDSYIMNKKLTKAQSSELEKALPKRFKQLDAEFHHRAEKLSAAAVAHDPELVTFHYSRLLESCVACHSEFANKRFPGFAAGAPEEHHH